MSKTIYTLNIDNYEPEITALTYPYIEKWAKKIGADFKIITDRKFPKWPVTYEKLQIHELGKDSEWNIYIDSDALVHPDMFDITELMPKDTVLHRGADFAPNRWKYDNYFRRDGRNIGSGNWLTVASDWCLDLWRPFDDLTPEQAVNNIYPIQAELNSVITPDHLIDDYALSRNIARFGLKFKKLDNLLKEVGQENFKYFAHEYLMTHKEKIEYLKKAITNWKI